MPLRILADELWCAEHDHWMSGVHFPGRMVVARLRGGGLWLWSAVPIDDLLAAELEALGPVRHIVVPNLFHHLHAAAAKARYPQATLWAPRAIADKRPDLAVDAWLDDATAPWDDELPRVALQGAPRLGEVAFLHAATRTLLLTDLVFHLHRYRGWWSAIVFRLVGVHGRLASSRLVRGLTRDRDAMRRSVAAMLAWDFDRLVVAHGDVVDTGAEPALRAALSHLLEPGASPTRALRAGAVASERRPSP